MIMIADAVLYAAGRAAGHTAEKVTRTVVWFALATFVFTLAAIAGVIGLFWYLEPTLGAVGAALTLAASGFLAALVLASVPSLMTVIEASAEKHKDPVSETIKVVETETREAVNYFGAGKVLISAFLLGIGTARSLKGR
jgi:hypothetical protein